MYEICKDEKICDGMTRLVCCSLDDVSQLLKDHPEIEIDPDEVEEGRTILAHPEWLGYCESDEVEFDGGLAIVVFSHRVFGGNILNTKHGWE